MIKYYYIGRDIEFFIVKEGDHPYVVPLLLNSQYSSDVVRLRVGHEIDDTLSFNIGHCQTYVIGCEFM